MSIAYARPYAAVDGNVVRVLSRLFLIDDDPSTGLGKKLLRQRADDLLDSSRPGVFNEALMELGATVCLPRNPRCSECPVAAACLALASDRVQDLPVRRKRRPVPHREIAVAIIERPPDEVFIQKRPENGLLGGLWEFPGGKIEEREDAEVACRREAMEELGVKIDLLAKLAPVNHAYSHFTVTLHAFVCRLESGAPKTETESRWVRRADLTDYAFPRANRRLAELLDAWRSDSSGSP